MAMNHPAVLLRALPLEVFEAPQPDDDWALSPLTTLSDAMLIQSVAADITSHKIQVSSSFVLHAPLELLARAWLLPYVSPDKRDDARRRIAEIAARYAGEGAEIEAQLDHLEIPVTEVAPEKAVECVGRFVETILRQGLIDLARGAIESGNNPAGFERSAVRLGCKLI